LLIRFAWIQANNALQVVSLLMSKEAPTQVMGTLDPELRNNVGIGSLGSTKLQDPPLWEEKRRDNTLVSTGAKLLAINNTANKLLVAATRLQNEMKVETEYWHEVLKIKEGGWPVSRLPNKPLTVAVKFGFSDCKCLHSLFHLRPSCLTRAQHHPVFKPMDGLNCTEKMTGRSTFRCHR
jgi:mediator of RNA polymerase II transcription subunit 17